MRKTAMNIRESMVAPATGVTIVLLSIASFIAALMILMTLVRVVMG